MPRINNYFSDEAHAYVKKQPTGYVGRLVEVDMRDPERESQEIMKETIEEETDRKTTYHVPKSHAKLTSPVPGDGKSTCKKCGAILTVYKGKCKLC